MRAVRGPRSGGAVRPCSKEYRDDRGHGGNGDQSCQPPAGGGMTAADAGGRRGSSFGALRWLRTAQPDELNLAKRPVGLAAQQVAGTADDHSRGVGSGSRELPHAYHPARPDIEAIDRATRLATAAPPQISTRPSSRARPRRPTATGGKRRPLTGRRPDPHAGRRPWARSVSARRIPRSRRLRPPRRGIAPGPGGGRPIERPAIASTQDSGRPMLPVVSADQVVGITEADSGEVDCGPAAGR